MSYTAPVKDMLFNMQHLANIEQIAQIPGFEDAGLDTAAAVLEECAKFTEGVLAPLNFEGDKNPSSWKDGVVTATPGFKDAFRQLTEGGWQGLQHPADFGGQGLPKTIGAACTEMLNSANMSFALCPLLTDGAIEALLTAGSDELKAIYLEKLISGQWTGTMNLTEPQAGSDLALVRTKADPQPDGTYKIFGTKIYITWGEHDMAENIVHLVLARLPGAPPGVKGISLFLCPKFLINDDGTLGEHNDLACTSIEHKMGIHGSPTASMSFGDGGGAIGYLVGEPNQGLACMFTMMNHARLNVGLEGVGISERAYQRARAYALERVQGKPLLSGSTAIAGHPDVRRMLMDMKARTEAMRALAYFCAGQMDRAAGHADAQERAQAQALVGLLIPVVKGWCTDSAQGITSDGVQVHGGMGYVEETGASQHMRDARITTIYEGTTGIQANDLIGRKLAREGGRTLKALLGRIDGDARRLVESPDAVLAQIGRALAAAAQALDEAVDWLLAHDGQPAQCAAGAVPFLRLAGTVIGGWLSARMAEAATAQLAAGAGDAGFLGTKRATASHYAAHVLVQAPMLRDIVTGGAASTLALADDQL